MNCCWDTSNDCCCRPSRLAEFVNGKGSVEKWKEEYCRRQAACCAQATCCDTSPERVINVYMPIRCPRPCTPCPRNRLGSIDILEEMMPPVRNCCVTSDPCCCDPCCDPCCNPCKVTRRHRITLQQPCCPQQPVCVTRWPNLPLPKKVPGCNLNPCPPCRPDPCAPEEDSDEEEGGGIGNMESGTYFWNEKTGKFEPCAPPPKPAKPQITIIKAPPQCPPTCPPPPQQIPVPWPIPMPQYGGGYGCPPCPWNPCQPFGGPFGGMGMMPPGCGAGTSQNNIPTMCCPPLDSIYRRRHKDRRRRRRRDRDRSGDDRRDRNGSDDEGTGEKESGSSSTSNSKKGSKDGSGSSGSTPEVVVTGEPNVPGEEEAEEDEDAEWKNYFLQTGQILKPNR